MAMAPKKNGDFKRFLGMGYRSNATNACIEPKESLKQHVNGPHTQSVAASDQYDCMHSLKQPGHLADEQLQAIAVQSSDNLTVIVQDPILRLARKLAVRKCTRR